MGTGRGCHALFQFFAGSIGLGFLVTAGNIVQNAFPWLLQHAHTVATVVGHTQLLAFCAVKDDIHHITGKAADRRGQGEMILLCQRLKIHPEDGICSGAAPAGSLNGTIKDGKALIRNDQVLIRHQLEAQTGTAGASAGGIVEGEHSGL